MGSTLAPGVDCTGTFQVTIPNNPALCGTAVADRVEIALRYTDVLIADAGATGITLIVCPADITITKTADALSKVGDSVTYTFEICNVGEGVVDRGTVTDTLLGDLTHPSRQTLDPDECATVIRMRTVEAGDPDPLPNTVTATYSTGASSDTATASASTNLFQPSVDITKNCTPDPVDVGGRDLHDRRHRHELGRRSGTGQRHDRRLADGQSARRREHRGRLQQLHRGPAGPRRSLGPARSSHGGRCWPPIPPALQHGDGELQPEGFPNNITDTATACVDVKPPPGGEGCTPGYWKQTQHFDSWVGFQPSQFFDAVFGVDVTLRSGGQGTIETRRCCRR